METDDRELHVGRRDFIKISALAGVAATLPAAGLSAQEAGSAPARVPVGKKRNLLFVNDFPENYEKLMESIRSIQEFEFSVTPVKINYQNLEETAQALQGKDADVIVAVLPRVTSNTRIVSAFANLNAPLILLPLNLDLIMLEADVCAGVRARGGHAMLANSEKEAIELIKLAATSRILEGKKALIFGRPFDSSSIPARNLNADYVYRHTGVRLEYRPIAELKSLLDQVSDASAQKEMERWKQEAVKIDGPSDRAILDCCRLYVLLRSIVEKEGLSCISIDCLSFSFNPNAILPLPCLAFTRLRDEGFAAPCEADVCASLSSMFLQEISGKPSYFANVSEVHEEKPTAVLRHCVAPTKLLGPKAPPLRYNLRDYHGLAKPGVTPEVEFPVGLEITMGGFTKDLKGFVLWPGRTIARVKDTDTPSFKNAPPQYAKMRKFCSNHLETRIKDVDGFLQNIAGCHHVMVAGSYTKAIRAALLRMNVNIIGPADSAAPA